MKLGDKPIHPTPWSEGNSDGLTIRQHIMLEMMKAVLMQPEERSIKEGIAFARLLTDSLLENWEKFDDAPKPS